MKGSRAYRAVTVKRVEVERLISGRPRARVHVGCDVGKEEVLTVIRWHEDDFERPWRAGNPGEIGRLVGLLEELAGHGEVVVAMEPTGTYGDPLRQALDDAGLVTHRVSPKAAYDYAEIFDGVPSQHDGKDAAVVAELSALGKSWVWPFTPADEVEQRMACEVDWLDAQRRILTMWYGRLEGLLARHWPEATRTLALTSGTLLRALAHYGGPRALASDAEAADRLGRWGGPYLGEEKVHRLLAEARRSVGVRQGEVDVARMQQYAQMALECRGHLTRSSRELERLAQGNPVIQAQAEAVGLVTACVLWVHLGDPHDYHCAAAYRKAMGLNLKERSSGKWRGRLKISKRGSGQVRRWLFYAVLRLVQKPPVRRWYRRKKARDQDQAGRALIGVMRKTALALYHVGARGVPFDVRMVFGGNRGRRSAPARVGSARESIG